jgi:hypothetical protein
MMQLCSKNLDLSKSQAVEFYGLRSDHEKHLETINFLTDMYGLFSKRWTDAEAMVDEVHSLLEQSEVKTIYWSPNSPQRIKRSQNSPKNRKT